MNKNLEFTKWLIERGAEINRPACKKTKNYPLHLAFKDAQIKDKFLIIQLIYKGGDLNVLNNKLETPLAFGS